MWAEGINNQGTYVISWADFSNLWHGSFYKGTTETFIDVPGATNTYVTQLTKTGNVIATWTDAKSVNHGALRYGGKYQKFDYPKAADTSAFGINDPSGHCRIFR
jgi:hypothetical protein